MRNAFGDTRINAFGDTRINAFGDTRINACGVTRISAFGVWGSKGLTHVKAPLVFDTRISEVHGKNRNNSKFMRIELIKTVMEVQTESFGSGRSRQERKKEKEREVTNEKCKSVTVVGPNVSRIINFRKNYSGKILFTKLCLN